MARSNDSWTTNPFQRHPACLAGLPRIVRLYILHCFVGFALAGIFTALILGLNVANLYHLVTNVSGGWLAAVVFFVLNGIVFSGVQTGITVMTLPSDDTPSPPQGPGLLAASSVPIPVGKDLARRAERI